MEASNRCKYGLTMHKYFLKALNEFDIYDEAVDIS